MARKSRPPELYVRPRTYVFSHGREDDLLNQLESLRQASSAHALMQPEELKLEPDGTTQHRGYRYTATAFRELCQLLASGAAAFIDDMAGMYRRLDQRRDVLVDTGLACDTFNRMVSLRFPLLESYRVIRNDVDGLIEGFVGSKQRTLGNLDLFRRAQQAFAENDVDFWGSALIGRRMLLWYRKLDPLFECDLQQRVWRFYHGYYICNGETRGTSVRGTSAVFTRYGLCLAPYRHYGGRLAHIGRDFQRRLDKMFRIILGKELPADTLQEGCRALSETPLGFGNLSDKERARRKSRLVRDLTTIGVPQGLGKEVIDSALLGAPTEAPPTIPVILDGRMLTQRTLFDVFCCLPKLAQRLNTRRREVLELAAYELLLSGGFSV